MGGALGGGGRYCTNENNDDKDRKATIAVFFSEFEVLVTQMNYYS